MPRPMDSTTGFKGSWMVISAYNDTHRLAEKSISGELMAIQSDTVYLLTDSALVAVNRNMINSVVLYLFKPQTKTAPLISGLSYLPNVFGAIAINEGAVLLLGVPLLITGAVMSAIESTGSVMRYPGKYQLKAFSKFARFPQGLPPGLDPEKLHLKLE